MALPLLPLSSSLALDDDELQESTEGRIKNLLGRGKRSARTNTPREDYDDTKWKAAARKVAITKLPAAFGGRMLRFQKEPIPNSKVKKYTLRVGVVGADRDAQYMLVVRPEIGGRFHAMCYQTPPDGAMGDGTLRWKVGYFTKIVIGEDGIEIVYYPVYPQIKDKSNQEDPFVIQHTFVRDVVETVVKFVDPRNGLQAPNDFERAYDDDSDKRALARFLRGEYGV